MVHIPDVLADPEYAFPKGQQLGGYRSNLGVPLLRDGVPIGAFVLMRPVVKPFSDKQIELVENVRRPGRDRHRKRSPAQ